MKSLAVKVDTKESTKPHRQGRHVSTLLPQRAHPLMPVLSAATRVQRKGACACDGACPRCLGESTLQAKLKVNQPGDVYEQEADRISEQVMRIPGPQLQRECTECGEEEQIQGKAGRASGAVAPPIVHQVLQSSGQALDTSTRAFMEPRFGHDFSGVRIHTDAKASESARAVNALAYTVGRELVFGVGQYAPNTDRGRKLLAHELTHVVQQSANGEYRAAALSGNEPGLMESRETEQQAEGIAQQVVGRGMEGGLRPLLVPPNSIQRQRVGTAVTHPAGARSAYRVITGDFDGREFVLRGDSTELMRVTAQSGRPYSVRPGDASACGGSTGDSYLNNPRYVGIADNGPIPEGEYRFRATQMATFSASEQRQMILGGHYTDPFGADIHGGDWGAGRVALNPTRVLPGLRGCGNTSTRSGFYLHGGIAPGSSGCIDVGNAGFENVVRLLAGYRGQVIVTVRYRHPAPQVGPLDRAAGRFMYPGQENPSIWDRIGSVFSF